MPVMHQSFGFYAWYKDNSVSVIARPSSRSAALRRRQQDQDSALPTDLSKKASKRSEMLPNVVGPDL